MLFDLEGLPESNREQDAPEDTERYSDSQRTEVYDVDLNSQRHQASGKPTPSKASSLEIKVKTMDNLNYNIQESEENNNEIPNTSNY